MNTSKQQYLDSIRSNSAYPTYRGFIGIIALLGFLEAGAIGFGALIGAISTMSYSFFLGLAVLIAGGIFAAFVFLLARFFKEAALIVADIGDATIESSAHSRATAAAAPHF